MKKRPIIIVLGTSFLFSQLLLAQGSIKRLRSKACKLSLGASSGPSPLDSNYSRSLTGDSIHAAGQAIIKVNAALMVRRELTSNEYYRLKRQLEAATKELEASDHQAATTFELRSQEKMARLVEQENSIRELLAKADFTGLHKLHNIDNKIEAGVRLGEIAEQKNALASRTNRKARYTVGRRNIINRYTRNAERAKASLDRKPVRRAKR